VSGTDTTPTGTDTTPTGTDTTPTGTETTPTGTGTTPAGPDAPGPDEGDPDNPEADEPDDPTRIAIFPWVTSGGFDENWKEGLGLAALGLVGAIVLLFVSFGDFLPAMGGKADYLARKAELDELVEQRSAQFALREKYVSGGAETTPEREAASAALTDDLETAIQQMQREVAHERNRLLWTGMVMYALLGAAFAVLFSSNALQALLIGFGWTAVAERLGLRSELADRSDNRQKAIEELREDAQRAVDDAEKARLAAVAAEDRADKNAKLAVGLSGALRTEAEARKEMEQQVEAASGQAAPQTPPAPGSQTPQTPPAPGSEAPEASEEPQ
jgi:hypothetical protein